MANKVTIVPDWVKDLITLIGLIIVIGGWVTRTEVDHANDKSDIDSNAKAIVALTAGIKEISSDVKEIKNTQEQDHIQTLNGLSDIKLEMKDQQIKTLDIHNLLKFK